MGSRKNDAIDSGLSLDMSGGGVLDESLRPSPLSILVPSTPKTSSRLTAVDLAMSTQCYDALSDVDTPSSTSNPNTEGGQGSSTRMNRSISWRKESDSSIINPCSPEGQRMADSFDDGTYDIWLNRRRSINSRIAVNDLSGIESICKVELEKEYDFMKVNDDNGREKEGRRGGESSLSLSFSTSSPSSSLSSSTQAAAAAAATSASASASQTTTDEEEKELMLEEPPIVFAVSHLSESDKAAVRKQKIAVIKLLLSLKSSQSTCTVNSLDRNGFGGMHWAAALNACDVMYLLFENGADVNIRCKSGEGDTPLHRACRMSQLDAIRLLLTTLKADASIYNNKKMPPIDCAASYNTTNRQATPTAKSVIRRIFFELNPSSRTLVLHHPDCQGHRTMVGHQEAPGRIPAIINCLKSSTLFEADEVEFSESFERASISAILAAHHSDYVNFVVREARNMEAKTPRSKSAILAFTPRVQQEVEKRHEKRLKPANACDTSFSVGSLDAALRAAGSVITGVNMVHDGRRRSVSCIVRPPGHHAGYKGHVANSASCGFCIFNSVAIGALHALNNCGGINKVAIVDFDVHHGNGTEEIIKIIDRPEELFFASVHLFDDNFYPGSGDSDSVADNCMNIAINPLWNGKGGQDINCGRNAFRNGISQRLLPAMRAFNPDIVLISAGFDGAKNDIGNKRDGNRLGDGGLDLSKEDFHYCVGLCKQVRR